MTKRMEIGGYLIVQLEDQLTPEAAFGELIENSLDAGASKIEILFTKNTVSISDNGEGTDDPNLIATPSQSASRYKKKAIGSKAIGAKQAMATFGRMWEIQTVPKRQNKYHRYHVAWKENEPLPLQYEGPVPSLPARSAPQEIKNGGTKITVTGRRDGFPTIRLDAICNNLERTYRPCLGSDGTKITVRNPTSGFSRQLANAAYDTDLFIATPQEIKSTVAGKDFTVRYGILKDGHRALSGCHLIFWPRILQLVGVVGDQAVPSGCYIDVILSDKWKGCLSTNKNSLARYGDELNAKLDEILKDWIAEQIQAGKTYRLKLIEGRLKAMFDEAISFLDTDATGEFDKLSDAPAKSDLPRPPGPPKPPNPGPKYERRQRAEPGTIFGATKELRRRCAQITVVADEKLAHQLYGVKYNDKVNEVVVSLNTGKHQREIAEYFNQGKLDELYKVAVMGFAVYVAENKNSMFLNLFAALRKHGYEIDASDPNKDIIGMVSNFLLDVIWNTRHSIKRTAA